MFGKSGNEILNGDCLRMETVGELCATAATTAPISPPINRRKGLQRWKNCQNGPAEL